MHVVCLDANTGTLQWLCRKTADVADEPTVSTNTACWHWQTDRRQEQISELQVYEDQ